MVSFCTEVFYNPVCERVTLSLSLSLCGSTLCGRCFFEYISKTWVLKENMTNKLMTFERKIMRKIFGPTRTDDGCSRIKTNQEINDTLKEQNIIGFIKKQRLNWLGHVERMAEDNIVQKIKRWKPMFKRPVGRPETRLEDDFWKI